MAFCTQCGSKLNDGAVFCGQCGAKVFSGTAQSQSTNNGFFNKLNSTVKRL
ncbi:MAG: zinc-ribbon domain-containing protein [Ruminococcus callidus]